MKKISLCIALIFVSCLFLAACHEKGAGLEGGGEEGPPTLEETGPPEPPPVAEQPCPQPEQLPAENPPDGKMWKWDQELCAWVAVPTPPVAEQPCPQPEQLPAENPPAGKMWKWDQELCAWVAVSVPPGEPEAPSCGTKDTPPCPPEQQAVKNKPPVIEFVDLNPSDTLDDKVWNIQIVRCFKGFIKTETTVSLGVRVTDPDGKPGERVSVEMKRAIVTDGVKNIYFLPVADDPTLWQLKIVFKGDPVWKDLTGAIRFLAKDAGGATTYKDLVIMYTIVLSLFYDPPVIEFVDLNPFDTLDDKVWDIQIVKGTETIVSMGVKVTDPKNERVDVEIGKSDIVTDGVKMDFRVDESDPSVWRLTIVFNGDPGWKGQTGKISFLAKDARGATSSKELVIRYTVVSGKFPLF